jgi:hypothetical protein
MSGRLAGSAIFAKLTSTAGTAVWGQRVREDIGTESDLIGGQPYLVYNYVSGGPSNVQKTRMEDFRFDVKCVALTKAQAETGADYIDSAFHDQTLTVNGYTNWATTVIGEIRRVDNHEGKQFWTRGKQVRIRLSSTT